MSKQGNAKMRIKALVDEDFINYKIPSMFIAFPSCTFKCEKECGVRCCQNSDLATSKSIDVDVETIAQRYKDNPITQAIVCGGLEPMDSFEDLVSLIEHIRHIGINDEIVIYTGYKKSEIVNKIRVLSKYENIIVKYGRYIPNQEKHYDEVLGVYLASDNQYAGRLKEE